MSELKDVATKLADAAIESVNRQAQPTYFDEIFVSLKACAQDIARAVCISTAKVPPVTASQAVTILNAYLQHKLTQEHVDAQSRMARTNTRLTIAIIVLAVISVIIALIPLFHAQNPNCSRATTSSRSAPVSSEPTGAASARHDVAIVLAVYGESRSVARSQPRPV